jgi:hypothetical protein
MTKILALDLGKFNTMCCFFDTESREFSFVLAATDRNYLKALLKKHPVDVVVMEACGPPGWIHDLAVQCGLKTLVCSTKPNALKPAECVAETKAEWIAQLQPVLTRSSPTKAPVPFLCAGCRSPLAPLADSLRRGERPTSDSDEGALTGDHYPLNEIPKQ